MNPETPITDALWGRLSLQGWTRGLLPVSTIMESHEQLERELADQKAHADEIYKAAVDLAAKLEDDLEQERALADRLANTLQVYVRDGVHLGHWMPAGAVILSERALAAWKEARK